ncbi:MSEP-CTERM sorting domain-containing protein, partial [Bacteroidales bacterium OttesenSCG-928-I14]|nr:MSEP-CTERM sorting domain-containing protein [Bacteroidales bacterium OttesenSCG-928-I14]
VALLCYITFIYLYGLHLEEILPFDIPRWMISDNLFIYVGTFLMSTLIYSIFILVVHFTADAKDNKAWKSFLIAIAIPVLAYLFLQIGLPSWRIFDENFGMHAALIIFITGTLIFLFFLIRGVYILATKKADILKKYTLIWEIPITILLPISGLLVNNGFNDFIIGDSGVFGDFNSYWFYVLAIVNGVFICLPNLENKLYRLFLFFGRCVTFAYTLYFFLVFLPFLPLSIIAIIAVGTGFLMLTPLLLFVIHANKLSKDFSFLKSFLSKKTIIAVSALGFILIPASITTNYLEDKKVLNKTLEYLYTPDYSKQYSIDKKSLQKTLAVIKRHKDNNSGGIFGSQQPYLSSYFNWIVLNNLTLSNNKIDYINQVFFGETPDEPWYDDIRNEDVDITDISTSSIYDNKQKLWKSRVDLEISNNRTNSWFAEYATTIDLPEGCWISDYYLYVGDRKEYGILAEKRSAMWVFSNIRNENRDPGILYYLTGNKVAFRVFPFANKEVRKTGIEFLHKEPVSLNIDNYIVELGNIEETSYENIENENIAFVSSQEKQTLKPVKRKPSFHFLVDASEGKDEVSTNFAKRIETALKNNPQLSENAQISFVNTYVDTYPLNDNLMQLFDSSKRTFEGGFYLDRAIKTALFNANKNKQYTVIVVVTNNIRDAILDKDFSDLRFTFPESEYFFMLDADGNLNPHSLINNPKAKLEINSEYLFHETVLEYKLSDKSTAYLPNNNQPSIVLKNDIFDTSMQEIKEKDWQSGLMMQAKWMSQNLHPETSNKEWLNLVKYSFISRIMSPVTSYLVVENEAQKAILQKKQEQVLSSNKSLDLDEDTQRMSEPSLWLLIILLGLVVLYRRVRTCIKTSSSCPSTR